MSHNDPAVAVLDFGFRTSFFGRDELISENWEASFARAGAGRFRKQQSGTRIYEGFHVVETETIESADGQRDVVIYLTADPGFAEADLDKVCAPLAAQLGVAVVTQGQRSGRWFTLMVTNRPPTAFPRLRISRSQPALNVIDLVFRDGSGRVEKLTYGQDLKT